MVREEWAERELELRGYLPPRAPDPDPDPE
jgi:hypothetical protein